MNTAPVLHVSTARQQCGSCPIRARAICAYCVDEELKVLDSLKSYRTYEVGQVIAHAGDPLTHIGSVVSGVATLSETLEDGRRQMVGMLLPSDYVGRPGRPSSQFDITATTEVLVCQFSKKPFEELITRFPSIGRRLLDMTLDELDAARHWMLLLGRMTAREKIARLFVVLAEREITLSRQEMSDSVTFDLPLTREAMSDYLGLTIETVSRQIGALKRDGIIKLDGQRRVAVPCLDDLRGESGEALAPGHLL